MFPVCARRREKGFDFVDIERRTFRENALFKPTKVMLRHPVSRKTYFRMPSMSAERHVVYSTISKHIYVLSSHIICMASIERIYFKKNPGGTRRNVTDSGYKFSSSK